MKKNSYLALFYFSSIFIGGSLCLAANENQKPQPSSVSTPASSSVDPTYSFYVDLEPIPDAKQYEVRAQACSTSKKQSKSNVEDDSILSKSNSNHVQLNLPAGIYCLSTRVTMDPNSNLYDDSNRVSTWSKELQEIHIEEIKPLPDIPMNGSKIVEVEFEDEDKDKNSAETMAIQEKNLYFIKIQKNASKFYPESVLKYLSNSPRVKLPLGPGKYSISARALHADKNLITYNKNIVIFSQELASSWSDSSEFKVPLPAPKIISPQDKAQVAATSIHNSNVKIKWSTVTDAEMYKIDIYDPKGKLLQSKFTSDVQLQVELPEAQTYTWQVTALDSPNPDPNYSTTPTSASPKQSFSIDEAVLHITTETEEPSTQYLMLRNITTRAFYKSMHDDFNDVEGKTWASSFELGAGQWVSGTRWGWMAAASIAGISLNGQNNLYETGHLFAGYRRLQKSGNSLRIWLGAAFVETPDVLYNALTEQVSFAKIQSLGPELRLSYLGLFSGKWGWHAYLNLFYGLTALKTTNKAQLNPTLSYSPGLQVSYRVRDNIAAMIGYAYSLEKASYKSNTSIEQRTNRTNTGTRSNNIIDAYGHFLSLGLQIGIGEKVQ